MNGPSSARSGLAGAMLAGCAALLLALVLAGCSSGERLSPDEQAVRDTILRYNELLAEGYRSLNMNKMAEVAVQVQAEDEYIHMSSLAEGGIRLDPELTDVRFERVRIGEASATVETKETWDYRHYGRVDGKLVLEQKGLVYELAWDLERQADGRWLVSDVRAVSATTTTDPKVIGTITPTPSQNR